MLSNSSDDDERDRGGGGGFLGGGFGGFGWGPRLVLDLLFPPFPFGYYGYGWWEPPPRMSLPEGATTLAAARAGSARTATAVHFLASTATAACT